MAISTDQFTLVYLSNNLFHGLISHACTAKRKRLFKLGQMVKVIDIWWILNTTVKTRLALFEVMHILAFAASTKPYRLPSAFLVTLVPESLKVSSSFFLVHKTIISENSGEVK
jgi:hypothetical protein